MAMRASGRAGLQALSLCRTSGSSGAACSSGLMQTQQRGFADGEPTVTVEVRPYKAHLIDAPSHLVETTKSQLLQYFEEMYRMRRLEISADMAYKAKFIQGFCHLYDGQEAVQVGIEAAITKKDSIMTSYRDHCTHIGRGGSVKEVMAELMGRFAGASKGKGGSMHMYRKEANFYGGAGIVGAQVPLAAGMAFYHKYMKDGCVALGLYGDGAANQGQVSEAMNIAALWDLPCLFICENNHYGMGTAEWRAAKSPNFYTRGDYIPGLRIDGMDVLAVRQGVAYAKQHAVANGPIILEMDTYRYHGHSMSDPGSTYRTRDEISSMRQQRDPVEHVRKLLTEECGADPAELKKIEKAIKKEVDAAVEEAKSSPYPPDSELWSHVYKEGLGARFRGVDSQASVELK